jgi:hypothetical protein
VCGSSRCSPRRASIDAQRDDTPILVRASSGVVVGAAATSTRAASRAASALKPSRVVRLHRPNLVRVGVPEQRQRRRSSGRRRGGWSTAPALLTQSAEFEPWLSRSGRFTASLAPADGSCTSVVARAKRPPRGQPLCEPASQPSDLCCGGKRLPETARCDLSELSGGRPRSSQGPEVRSS